MAYWLAYTELRVLTLDRLGGVREVSYLTWLRDGLKSDTFERACLVCFKANEVDFVAELTRFCLELTRWDDI